MRHLEEKENRATLDTEALRNFPNASITVRGVGCTKQWKALERMANSWETGEHRDQEVEQGQSLSDQLQKGWDWFRGGSREEVS